MEQEKPNVERAVEHIETARDMVLEAVEKAKAGTDNRGTLDVIGDTLDSALEALGHPVETPLLPGL
jgi:hypothetical protein